jgi:hypothetical protein
MPRAARAGAALVAVGAVLSVPSSAAARSSALVVLVPASPATQRTATSAQRDSEAVLGRLARHPELALGLVSATHGRYGEEQALLDLSQGTRAAMTAYDPEDPPPVRLVAAPGAGGRIAAWDAVLARARTARLPIRPGLLAASVPGGGAYVGVVAHDPRGVVVADRRGDVAGLSLGPAETLVDRAAAALRSHALVLVDLPPGAGGERMLSELLARRGGGELVVAMQTPPPRTHRGQLLPVGIAGLGYAGELTSATTRQPGLLAGIDLAPTILRYLRLPVPAAMRGQLIHAGDRRDPAALDKLAARLRQVGPRRTRILTLALGALLVLVAAASLWGVAARRRALRVSALALLWSPAFALVPAAVDPPAFTVEALIVIGGSLLAGAITDRFVPWPRGPLVPAAVVAAFYAVDLANHSELIARSIIGPHPLSGARFYGIGNEFRSGLTVLVLAGLAAAAHRRPPSRALAAVFACAGALLAVLLGSGRLGAAVGGVIIVATATAVATVLLLPGGASRRALALAVLAPPVAVAALAGLDLITAGGNGHLAHDVLGVDAAQNLREAVVRRSGLALEALLRPMMLAATVLCVLALALAWWARDRLARLMPSSAWRAALAGGLAGGVVGSFTEDSGPLLFVVAVSTLAVLTAYLASAPGPDRNLSSP